MVGHGNRVCRYGRAAKCVSGHKPEDACKRTYAKTTWTTHLGLQHGVFGVVVLQHIKQKRGRFPDGVARQKHIRQRVEIDRRPRLLGHHLGQVDRCVRVGHHHRLHQVHVIWLVPLALGVVHERVKVTLGRQRLDDLGGGIGALVQRQGRLLVARLAKEVAQLLGGSELLLLEPVVEQVLFVLAEHELGELDRLVGVEL